MGEHLSVINWFAASLGDRFGQAVTLQGDTLVVGAPRESSSATGIGGALEAVEVGAAVGGEDGGRGPPPAGGFRRC